MLFYHILIQKTKMKKYITSFEILKMPDEGDFHEINWRFLFFRILL